MKILSFQEFVNEGKSSGGGEDAGTMEVAQISVKEAHNYTNDLFEKYQKESVDQAIPNFDKNFIFGQGLAQKGMTVRKDMPVIDTKDVKDLQYRLKTGDLDVRAPFAKGDHIDAFPEGLTGEDAKKWLKDGLPQNDGATTKTDDIVKCHEGTVVVGDLAPIQKQIYLSKCMEATAQNGVKKSIKFLEKTHLILSSDNHIIDGHHRWMSALLINPKMTIHALIIELPITTLLPLSIAYGDAVGNQRNA